MGVMSQPDPGPQAVTRSASVAPSAPVTLSGRRIVVVDDEKSITDLVSMALKLHGATVEVAHRGADGLRLVESFRPHLVVLDVMLPDLDGFEVLKRMGWDRQTASRPGALPHRPRRARRPPARPGRRRRRLHGRSRSASRRCCSGSAPSCGAPTSSPRFRPRLSVGDLTLDEESYEVWRGKSAMSLTPDRIPPAALPDGERRPRRLEDHRSATGSGTITSRARSTWSRCTSATSARSWTHSARR